MSKLAATAIITIGEDSFSARFRFDVAPNSCAQLQQLLLPYAGEVVHARWSGESVWSPLAGAWPAGLRLPPEHATDCPAPGDLLLFADVQSEPELLVVYGPTRFACQAGPLKGNPVLVIDDGLARLAEVGRRILQHGAMKVRLEYIAATNGPPTVVKR